MTKKKSKAGKANQPTRAQLQAHALKRLKATCDQLVGAGHFEKFSPLCKLKLISGRFPVLKLKITQGPGMNKESIELMSGIFNEHLSQLSASTATGEQMSLSSYMREALTLIFYVQHMDQKTSNHAQLQTAFSSYALEGELMREVVVSTVQLLHRFSMICSNWSTALFCYTIQDAAAFSETGSGNHITAVMQKPESCSIEMKGNKREILRIGWTDFNGKIIYLSLKPSQIGLKDKDDQPKDLYIQRHALNKLNVRLGIKEGLIHFYIYDYLREETLDYLAQGENSLLQFSLFDRKLGYLVCCLHENKIIIKTFLFLTNDGTPEGKKLAELTKLELLDKQYLGIDTLEGFIRFGIAEDPHLTKLFTQAGCADLLDLSEIRKYHTAEIKSKDPVVLLQYLMSKNAIETEYPEDIL